MKRKENKLNINISRLVKSAVDKDTPSDNFTEKLINDTLKELRSPADKGARGGGSNKMKTTKTKQRIIVYIAASVLLVVGVAAIMMPSLGKVKMKAREVVKQSEMRQKELENILAIDKAKDTDAVFVGSNGKTNSLTEEAKNYADGLKYEPVVIVSTNGKVPADSTSKSSRPGSVVRARPMHVGTPRSSASRNSSRGMMPGRIPGYAPNEDLGYHGDGVGMAHGGNRVPNGGGVDAMFFKNYGVNPFVDTEDDHLSTFATDVDTGSYTIARKYLHEGKLPPDEAVRVEEFVNYFEYDYPAPQEDTFAVYTHAEPWQFGSGRKNSYLMRIGLKARQVAEENRRPAVLTFVIDVSGSMQRENRLGLVKESLYMLIDKLSDKDKIGIAVYGSRGRKVLGHTSVADKERIIAAIRGLKSGGSTYAEEGIQIGYEMAEKAFEAGYINRVILCSDGVANVGNTGADKILEIIKDKAQKGITLSSLGFGMGNYNDVLLEQLGNKGDGYYAYIDTIAQAKRLFSNLTGALEVVARDVKVQVDFNPEVVKSYRLIGYENRDVPDAKFRDDKYDGGEMGAGHSATALYELKLYPEKGGVIATTYVRYKHPVTREVTEFNNAFATADVGKSGDLVPWDFMLASTAGEFAEILRKSYWAKGASLDETLQRAQAVARHFEGNADVIELTDLIAKTRRLWPVEDINQGRVADGDVMVPIPLELPKPMFVGTPTNIRVPGNKLEKPLGKPRAPFLAPIGVKNVAAGKPVIASDDFPVIGEVEMVTDGDKEAADGSYVDLGPFLQFVTIDLEKEYEIYAIVLWHYHKQARAYTDVVVQVADDEDFTQNVRTLFNNDHDNSAGLGVGIDWHYIETCEGKLIDAKGTKARYVRAYSDGNSQDDSTHFIEIEVFGK